MTSFRGGRGKQAPYSTTHMRIPEPLKPNVQRLVNEWRYQVDAAMISPTEPMIDVLAASGLIELSFSEAVQAAQKIMRRKKSANESMIQLLEAIYHKELDRDALRLRTDSKLSSN